METKLKSSKSAIYSAILKHGISMFKLVILEYCSSEKCIKLEQKHINFFKPEYNILKIAGSSFGRVATDETRAKLAAAKKGIKKSEETRAKMSASKMGNTNAKNHPNFIKIEVTDLELNTKTIYNSIHEAARALNIHPGRISEYFTRNQKKPYKGIYTFKKF
jgi:group I intron endonuclease